MRELGIARARSASPACKAAFAPASEFLGACAQAAILTVATNRKLALSTAVTA